MVKFNNRTLLDVAIPPTSQLHSEQKLLLTLTVHSSKLLFRNTFSPIPFWPCPIMKRQQAISCDTQMHAVRTTSLAMQVLVNLN